MLLWMLVRMLLWVRLRMLLWMLVRMLLRMFLRRVLLCGMLLCGERVRLLLCRLVLLRCQQRRRRRCLRVAVGDSRLLLCLSYLDSGRQRGAILGGWRIRLRRRHMSRANRCGCGRLSGVRRGVQRGGVGRDGRGCRVNGRRSRAVVGLRGMRVGTVRLLTSCVRHVRDGVRGVGQRLGAALLVELVRMLVWVRLRMLLVVLLVMLRRMLLRMLLRVMLRRSRPIRRASPVRRHLLPAAVFSLLGDRRTQRPRPTAHPLQPRARATALLFVLLRHELIFFRH